MMETTRSERLEMRWIPVLDAAGHTRMQVSWVPVAASHEAAQPVITHAA
jgi:hypothetical protein